MFIKNKPSAFTLIELSAVIVIIGILIAGVMTANGLVKKSKIAAAQSLTKASPINGIENNDLWLDSSQESSFKDNESSTGGAVTTWYDQKNASNKSLITVVGTGPTYSNTINYIHAVKFNGSNNDYLKLEDASFLNKNSYTIFVVEKRQSNSPNNYFLGDSAQTSTNQSLLLGYSADGSVIHSQSGSTLANASTASVDSYANYNDKPRVFAFNFDTALGSKTYINGTLSGQSSANLAPLTNVTSLSIGKGYSGEIGEIAIFSRSLKSEERKAVEDYLAKKWSVKMTRESAPSCTEGVITENGCKKTCPVSVVGVSSPTTIADGESKVLVCGATGYAGGTTKQSYTCSNGALSPTPSSTVCATASAITGGSNGANVCAIGYEQIGSSPCQPISCAVSGTVGTNTTTVTSASGTVSCNKTGYYGGPIAYTCVGGNFLSETCSKSCAVPVTIGTDTTTVSSSSGTVSCNKTGYYGGPANYTCSKEGLFKVVSDACQMYTKCKCTDANKCTTDTTLAPEVIHKFTTVGTATFQCDESVSNAKILVVGGGGSGGGHSGNSGAGGGGGGKVVYVDSLSLINSQYTIVVGAGGAGTTNTYGKLGEDSRFYRTGVSITAPGGAGGGGQDNPLGGPTPPTTILGGSSGGVHCYTYQNTNQLRAATLIGATGTAYGNIGGQASGCSNYNNPAGSASAGGGGGGAGGPGQNGVGTSTTAATGGAGGLGQTINITGSNLSYGAGGGGFPKGSASGGGGAGATSFSGSGSSASTDQGNYGGGGGGGGAGASTGNGAQGVVIVRYNNNN